MYAELCCRSYYSFLEGASSPDALAYQAAALGLSAIALTDRNGLYGALAFYRACREVNIKPIIGAQLTIEGGDENVYMMLTHHHDAGDRALCFELATLAGESNLPIVATNAPWYAKKEEGRLHDVLLCIKHRVTINTSHHQRPGNHNRHLKTPKAMQKLFHLFPEAIQNSLEVARRCDLNLDFSSYRVPDFPLPPDHTIDSYLAALTMENLSKRYASVTDEICRKVQEELLDREDVIQYVYKKYGLDHVAMVCTFITFQARSAIREVGKVLEIPDTLLDRLARLTSSYGTKDLFHDQEIHAPPLPTSQAWDLLRGEYSAQGFSAKRHPIALLRQRLNEKGVISSQQLQMAQDPTQVKLGGLVVCRQRPPTAKGFAFLTLEDEFGLMNIIIPPNLYEQVRTIFRLTPLVYVEGTRDEREGIVNVRATHLAAL